MVPWLLIRLGNAGGVVTSPPPPPPVIPVPVGAPAFGPGYIRRRKGKYDDETEDERRFRVFSEIIGELEDARPDLDEIAHKAKEALADRERAEFMALLAQIRSADSEILKLRAKRAAIEIAQGIMAEVQAVIRDDEDAILAILLST